jgi:hypothetical protein
VSAMVTSKLEGTVRRVPSGDGNGRGGCEREEYSLYICRSKMRTVFPNRITSSYYGAGDNNSWSRRTCAGGITGRVCPIYKLHGDVPHHKQASTFHVFGDGGRRSAILLVQAGAPSDGGLRLNQARRAFNLVAWEQCDIRERDEDNSSRCRRRGADAREERHPAEH